MKTDPQKDDQSQIEKLKQRIAKAKIHKTGVSEMTSFREDKK
jgi:hypothetical protein